MAKKIKVISKLISYNNLNNKKIIGFVDHSPSSKKNRHYIVIPPAFGETKTDSLSLSYFFVQNGFTVLRYDSTNHTGESSGSIFNFTLESGRRDLQSSIDFIQKELGEGKIGIVAKSLAWRYALRCACQDRRINYLLGVGGVVSLQNTIKAVYHEDLIDMVKRSEYDGWKIEDIFGFEVSMDFLMTSVSDRYHSASVTRKELNSLRIPFSYYLAENDAWVDIKDVRRTFAGNRENMHVVTGAQHYIEENPMAAMHLFKMAVVECVRNLYKENIDAESVIKPELSSVARQNREEKARLRPYELSKESEKRFWEEYLSKYKFIKESRDFCDYMDAIIKLLGGAGREEVILDAGCGPGHFGLWLLGAYRDKHPHYVALDIVRSVLNKSRKGHDQLELSTSKSGSSKKNSPETSYICGDLDCSSNAKNRIGICFSDNKFDKICCSLLVSYLKEPLSFLKECYRILKPNGKIIVSTLKPSADLSQIYSNFVATTGSDEHIKKARKLLSSAGMIKVKEKQGYYSFFTEKELVRMLKKSNFNDIKCYRALGNQVNLAVATK